MTSPDQPAVDAVQLPAEEVIAALGDVHGRTIAALSAEIAQLRVTSRRQAEQIRYLQSLQPSAAS